MKKIILTVLVVIGLFIVMGCEVNQREINSVYFNTFDSCQKKVNVQIYEMVENNLNYIGDSNNSYYIDTISIEHCFHFFLNEKEVKVLKTEWIRSDNRYILKFQSDKDVYIFDRAISIEIDL